MGQIEISKSFISCYFFLPNFVPSKCGCGGILCFGRNRKEYFHIVHGDQTYVYPQAKTGKQRILANEGLLFFRGDQLLPNILRLNRNKATACWRNFCSKYFASQCKHFCSKQVGRSQRILRKETHRAKEFAEAKTCLVFFYMHANKAIA